MRISDWSSDVCSSDLYDRTSLLLPTKAKLVEIPVTRAAFVEKTTTIDFEEGTLKQVDISKPSEVLEIVSLPVEILKAIVAIPAELIQLKIDTTNQEKKLIRSEERREGKERVRQYRSRGAPYH